jgi:hypothetical protein
MGDTPQAKRADTGAAGPAEAGCAVAVSSWELKARGTAA